MFGTGSPGTLTVQGVGESEATADEAKVILSSTLRFDPCYNPNPRNDTDFATMLFLASGHGQTTSLSLGAGVAVHIDSEQYSRRCQDGRC